MSGDTICLTCGVQQLDRDHLDWCGLKVHKRPGSPEQAPNEVEVYLVRAGDLEMQQVDYLEDPLLPLRMPTVVTGLDGLGKSTILYEKAARATRGQLTGAFEGQPVDVAIASCEDHPQSVILPRLIAAGADLDRVHIVRVNRAGIEGDIALPEDLPRVALKVEEVDARFLIIDPLVGTCPSASIPTRPSM